jgi:hypothetical protein
MNRMQQLDPVFSQLKEDDRVASTHVALYGTLARLWKAANYATPFSFDKTMVRQASKIRSDGALDKCLQELELWGYLRYFTSVESGQQGVISLHCPGIALTPEKRRRKSAHRSVLMPLPEPEEIPVWPKLLQVTIQAIVQLLIAVMNRHLNLF